MAEMVKLLLSWNIKPGRDQEYFEFMVREFAPGITRLGVTPTEAWFAIYGDCPQILMEGVLYEKLLTYVDDYQHKIVRASAGFQI
jgi:hypothetical protein